MIRFLIALLLLTTPNFALAQNEENTILNNKEEALSNTYSPEYCEFSVTFPSEPYKARRCEGEGKDRCYDLISYTQVYEMASTVNFRVICNPVGQELKDAYSPEVMKATLKAMTKQSVVKEFNTTFREEDNYKQAGLVGEGLSGRTPTIYIAQLWIGAKSALSVEAELIGEPMEDADTLLRDVLRSVGHKEELAKAAEEAATESSDNSDDDSDYGGDNEDTAKPTEP